MAPALLLAPAAARAQEVNPPGQPDGGLPTEPGYAPPTEDQWKDQLPVADPYETAADPSQVDWPQDLAPEEAAVDSYDDGYDPRAYAQFQDDLAPYGDWIDDGTYGRVWMPASTIVGNDFTPYYTGGRWLLTEFGWTWVSDWSWGWAPFHYGRWVLVSGFGWCWVPGSIWGPAWVTWRSGGGWVGWAALPPRGVSVTATFGHRSPWCFTRAGDLGARFPRRVPMHDMKGLFRRTTIVANDRVLTRGNTTVHINAGPTYIPRAAPVKLKAVAPHAFPQRAIFPRPGATMSARPWIRAANETPAPGAGGPGAGRNVGAVGSVAGRGFSTRVSSSPPSRIYNPPRAFASTVTPHAFGSPASSYSAPHSSGPPSANVGPRIYNHSSPAPAPSYGAPHGFGAPSHHGPVNVYSPPSRPFANPPAVNPMRSTFASPPAQFAPRTFAPSPAPRTFAPSPPFRQTFTPPMHASPPPQRFSAPIGGGGGFSRPGGGAPFGGGAHFGGGHRR